MPNPASNSLPSAAAAPRDARLLRPLAGLCREAVLVALLAVALFVAPLPAAAQDGGAAGQAIRGVISQQMAAFQRDDGGAAFSYASPGIRARFGDSPASFMEMVRSGYPSVYRPLEVEFRELSLEGAIAIQEVYVIGPDGRASLALYRMERQPDGSWRIDGVRLVELPETIS